MLRNYAVRDGVSGSINILNETRSEKLYMCITVLSLKENTYRKCQQKAIKTKACRLVGFPMIFVLTALQKWEVLYAH